MRAAVAFVVSTCLLGCFPHNARHRTYAQIVEGSMIAAGIGLEAVINSGADCDQMAVVGMPNSACHNKATILGDLGVALMLGGLLGFVATISTAEDDKVPPPIDIKAETPAKQELKLPPGVSPGPAPTAPPAPTAAAATPATTDAATPASPTAR